MVGKRIPLYCSGVGKALLADMSNDEIKSIWDKSDKPPLTEHTITDFSKFMQEIEETRKRGYALDNEEKQIYDGNGNPVYRPCSVDKSVLGSIDDLGDDEDDTGEGSEEIDVDLTKTSSAVKEILFTVSIYWNPNNLNDPRRKYNFGQVRDAFIQIKNALTGEIICRYDLDEDFSTDKGVEFGRLYRRGTEWKFQAVGDAHTDGLEPICKKYASKFM